MITNNYNITIEQYLNDVENEVIVPAGSGNRLTGQMLENKKAAASLIATAFHGWYTPSILKCLIYIMDGNNRTYVHEAFRFKNFRLPKKFDNQIVTYEEMVKDENGKVVRDENGEVKTIVKEYDLGNHTYDELPKELKNIYNRYTLNITEFVLDAEEKKEAPLIMNRMMRMYNQTICFNGNQIAFTHINNFSTIIRNEVMMADLYKAEYVFSKKMVLAGGMEKIICDAIMFIYFPNEWKKNAVDEFEYVNDNANANMFKHIAKISQEFCDCFDDESEIKAVIGTTKSDMGAWLCAYDKFRNFNVDHKKFAEFFKDWKDVHSKMLIDGKNFDEIVGDRRSGKDKTKAHSKVNFIVEAMKICFDVKDEDITSEAEETEITAENINEVNETEATEVIEETEVVKEVETKDEANTTKEKDASGVLFDSDYVKEIIDNMQVFSDLEFETDEIANTSNQIMSLILNVPMYKLRNRKITDDEAYEITDIVETFEEIYEDVNAKINKKDVAPIIATAKTVINFAEENKINREVINEKYTLWMEDFLNKNNLNGTYDSKFETMNRSLEKELSFRKKAMENETDDMMMFGA